jgi:hypothetical protein
MQNVPKFVLKRLQERVPGAESHPDADLLTAFAERSLAGRERDLLMVHLAVCGDCREVVTLALPATESIAQTDSPRSTGVGWFAWPVLRWGALAAGMLAVASVGVLQSTHRQPEKTVASNLMQRDLMQSREAPAPSTLAQPALPAPVSRMEIRDKKSTARELVSKATPAMPPPGLAVHGRAASGRWAGIRSGSGGGMGVGASPVSSGANEVFPNRDARSSQALETTLQGQNAAPEIHQQVKVGASSTVVEVQSAAGPANTESAAIGVPQNQLAQNQADLPVRGRKLTTLDVVKAKDPVPAQPATALPDQPAQTSSSVMPRALPRWAITPAGALQRSLDGGNTWENVVPSLSAGGRAAMAISSPTTRRSASGEDKPAEKPAEKEENKDQTAVPAPSPSLIFRALAVSGLDVWAGASGGALYHTSDGGNRWARVIPSEAGAILTGDITSIQFSDPQNGKVATSTGELWTTADAGQIWRKQP